MRNSILKFGALGSAIMVIALIASTQLMSVENSDNYGIGEVIGFSSMILSFITILLAIREVRAKNNDGSMTFGKGLSIGLLVSLMVSAVYVITWMIYLEVSDSNFIEEYSQAQIEKVQQNDELSTLEKEEQIDAQQQMVVYYQNPAFRVGITFMEIFPIGLLFSLLYALVMMRKGSSRVIDQNI
tara:strand:- start:4639 stop:5190 length:552 start_codon:yes stop_codon:yes gene_type:complete